MRSSLFWDVTRRRLLIIGVLVQPISPIFKGQAVQDGDLEDGNDRLSRNVGKYQSTPRNIQEEKRSHKEMFSALSAQLKTGEQ
jgi:hypothetical protein